MLPKKPLSQASTPSPSPLPVPSPVQPHHLDAYKVPLKKSTAPEANQSSAELPVKNE